MVRMLERDACQSPGRRPCSSPTRPERAGSGSGCGWRRSRRPWLTCCVWVAGPEVLVPATPREAVLDEARALLLGYGIGPEGRPPHLARTAQGVTLLR